MLMPEIMGGGDRRGRRGGEGEERVGKELVTPGKLTQGNKLSCMYGTVSLN